MVRLSCRQCCHFRFCRGQCCCIGLCRGKCCFRSCGGQSCCFGLCRGKCSLNSVVGSVIASSDSVRVNVDPSSDSVGQTCGVYVNTAGDQRF